MKYLINPKNFFYKIAKEINIKKFFKTFTNLYPGYPDIFSKEQTKLIRGFENVHCKA